MRISISRQLPSASRCKAICGRLATPSDQDLYRFTLAAAQRIGLKLAQAPDKEKAGLEEELARLEPAFGTGIVRLGYRLTGDSTKPLAVEPVGSSEVTR